MICSRCGNLAENTDVICKVCGAILERDAPAETGAMAIRQGRRARQLKEASAGQSAAAQTRRRSRTRGASREPVIESGWRQNNAAEIPDVPVFYAEDGNGFEASFDDEADGVERRNAARVFEDGNQIGARVARIDPHARTHRVTEHMVNWTRVFLAAGIVLFLGIVGAYVWLTQTGTGNRLLVRVGMEDKVKDSMALWDVGEEKLDSGDIIRSIELFENAKKMDEEAKASPNVDGLLLLGYAYEADDRKPDAAALYQAIYEETPSRSEAYENHIRILMASDEPGDQAKAGELMKLAYEKTGESKFSNQRSTLLPLKPEVDLTAGYYETKKYIALTSPQEYDVYYTFDENAELPYGGVKYTERIFMDEGIYSLRAVAVNGELVSDELTGVYKIIMPSPQTPRASLAPNTYQNRQWVGLKPGEENEKDDDIILYYTIDGSTPDADSPIFTPGDKKIALPGGRVTLKAVAVNKYGKVSNTLEILYKIEAKPYPLSAYSSDDTANGIVLYSTTMQEFQDQYGEGESMEEIALAGYDGIPVRKYHYSWGYADMAKLKSGWVLCRLYFTSRIFSGPRNTGIGDSMDSVVGKFRDMGQVASASGNRGLYKTGENEDGKILKQEDGSYILRYRCVTADSHVWSLEYITNNSGTVTAIDMSCLP